MKNFLQTLILIILSSISTFSQTDVCVNNSFDLQGGFSSNNQNCYTSGSATHTFSDVDHIELWLVGTSWTKDVTSSTSLNLSSLYNEISIANPNYTTKIPVIKISYEKDLAFSQYRCEIASKTIRIYGPRMFDYNIPNQCPSGFVNFNQYVTDGSGVFTATSGNVTIPFTSNVADLNGVSPGIFTPILTASELGQTCTFTKTGSSFNFTVFSAPSVSWTGNLTSSVLDSDSPINLTPYISSSGGTVTVSGAGVVKIGSDWYFDPGLPSTSQSVTLSLSIESVDGCVYDHSVYKNITVTHDPGKPPYAVLDLNYFNFYDYSQFISTGYWPYYGLFPSTNTEQSRKITTRILGSVQNVCSNYGDTLKMKIGSPEPGYTYNWYSNINGSIVFLHSGTIHHEPIPNVPTYLTYNIFFVAVNSLNVEGDFSDCQINVNPAPTNAPSLEICHDGVDSTYRLPFDYNHHSTTLFYVGNQLDSSRMEHMTNYNWYDDNDNFLGRSYEYDFSWTQGAKTETVYFVKTDSSAHHNLFGNIFVRADPFVPNNIPYYNYYSSECSSLDTGSITFIRTPIPSYTTTQTTLDYYDSVNFINTSLYTDTAIWNFGDNTGQIQGDNIWHYYDEIGNYTTSLTVKDQYGCSADTIVANEVIVLYPGIPARPVINLSYSGIDYASWNSSFIPNYSAPRDTMSWANANDSIRWHITDTIASHKSVCGLGDTLNYFIADSVSHDTYRWYSDFSGVVSFLHEGRTHTEIIAPSSVYEEYSLYYSATNFVNQEGPKNKITIRINPNPTSGGVNYTLCHSGVDTLYELAFNTDHMMNDSFNINGVLDDTSYLEQITNYHWFDDNNNFINRGYRLNYTWNVGQKVENFYFVRVDSSNQALGRSYPYYNLTGAECLAQDTGLVTFTRNPIAKHFASDSGIVAPGTVVQFIDQSQYADNITWNFNDQTGVYSDPIEWHYYNQIGVFPLTHTATDNYGCSDQITKPAFVTVLNWLGISENQAEEFNISIFPNPTSGSVTINTSATVLSNEIYNLNGQLILKTESVNFDISSLSDGVYIVRTITSEKIFVNNITLNK